MAEKTAFPQSLYAFGEGEESALANQRYQDAYNQLIAAVEKRSKPQFFDPTLLAISQAFLGPTKTGGFGEAAGVAAGNVAKSQEAQQTRQEDLARMRLELAGMGVERASQRGIVQNLAKKAGITPSAEPTGTAPSGVAAGQPAVKPPEIEEGMEPIGRFPVNPNLIRSEQDFYRRALESGQRDPVAIGKEWVQYQKDFLSPKFEGGNVYDQISGNIYSKTTGGTATTTFMTGQQGSFAIPEASVREHQRLIRSAQKDPKNPEVWARLESFEDFWRTPHTKAVQTPTVINTPIDVTPAVAPSAPAAAPLAAAPAAAPARVPPPPPPPPANAPAAPASVIPSPPSFNAPLRFTPAQRPPGRLSAEQKAAFDAEDKTRLDAALALQKEELAAQKAKYDAEIAEGKAQRDLARDVSKAGQIEGQSIANIPAKKFAEQGAEQEVKARQEIDDNRKEADATVTFANQFRKYAELPNAKQMFGILNNQDLSSGLAKLITNTIQAGSVKIGMPEIEEVMRNANMSRTEQAQYRNFLQLSTQLQLQRAKYMKGSVSNYEQNILGNAGIGPQDTPETIRMKADIMAARAQFDRKVARKFKDSKKDAAKFLSSDDYYGMLDEYDAKLGRLVGGETRLQPRPQRSGSAVQNADSLLGIR